MIYFILDPAAAAVKIGFTRSPGNRRFKQLKTGNPKPTVLLGMIPGSKTVEREIHDHFQPQRLRGEWFHYGDVVKLQVLGILQDGWPIP